MCYLTYGCAVAPCMFDCFYVCAYIVDNWYICVCILLLVCLCMCHGYSTHHMCECVCVWLFVSLCMYCEHLTYVCAFDCLYVCTCVRCAVSTLTAPRCSSLAGSLRESCFSARNPHSAVLLKIRMGFALHKTGREQNIWDVLYMRHNEYKSTIHFRSKRLCNPVPLSFPEKCSKGSATESPKSVEHHIAEICT